MANKKIFDLLKEKMAALRPSEQHRDGDWAALADRLEAALPVPRQKGRRRLVLPLLLAVALLASNASWWQSSRSKEVIVARLEAQVSDLQVLVSASAAVPTVVRTDTVWQTVYVRTGTDIGIAGQRLRDAMPNPSKSDQDAAVDWEEEHRLFAAPKDKKKALPHFSEAANVSGDMALEAGRPEQLGAAFPDSNSTAPTADLSYLKGSGIDLLHWPRRVVSPPPNATMAKSKTTAPSGQSLMEALRPRFIKAGGNVGWLYANSAGLMHEGGFSYGLHGEVGFSRHWSLTTDFVAGILHYKAHVPEAILGAPDLPMLPSAEHHFAEMDVTGQKIRQFSLGLRYTFAEAGQNRLYIGLGWVGQTVLPYTVAYEIRHEPSGVLQKDAFMVATRTRMRNIPQLSAGVGIPLSSRLEFLLEGFYQRQWKKPSAVSPDLMGIRGGANWSF